MCGYQEQSFQPVFITNRKISSDKKGKIYGVCWIFSIRGTRQGKYLERNSFGSQSDRIGTTPCQSRKGSPSTAQVLIIENGFTKNVWTKDILHSKEMPAILTSNFKFLYKLDCYVSPECVICSIKVSNISLYNQCK